MTLSSSPPPYLPSLWRWWWMVSERRRFVTLWTHCNRFTLVWPSWSGLGSFRFPSFADVDRRRGRRLSRIILCLGLSCSAGTLAFIWPTATIPPRRCFRPFFLLQCGVFFVVSVFMDRRRFFFVVGPPPVCACFACGPFAPVHQTLEQKNRSWKIQRALIAVVEWREAQNYGRKSVRKPKNRNQTVSPRSRVSSKVLDGRTCSVFFVPTKAKMENEIPIGFDATLGSKTAIGSGTRMTSLMAPRELLIG